MKKEAEELKALLQYKKQTISELDRLLYQEITTPCFTSHAVHHKLVYTLHFCHQLTTAYRRKR